MPRYAAVDIGSNSVRMMAAEVNEKGTRILVQERQVTRLGESVFRTGAISGEALDFLCGILRGMAAAYGKLQVAGVRAVATSAAARPGADRRPATRGLPRIVGRSRGASSPPG